MTPICNNKHNLRTLGCEKVHKSEQPFVCSLCQSGLKELERDRRMGKTEVDATIVIIDLEYVVTQRSRPLCCSAMPGFSMEGAGLSEYII